MQLNMTKNYVYVITVHICNVDELFSVSLSTYPKYRSLNDYQGTCGCNHQKPAPISSE